MLLNRLTPAQMAKMCGLDEALCRAILTATKKYAPAGATVTHENGLFLEIWFDPTRAGYGLELPNVSVDGGGNTVSVDTQRFVVIERPTRTDRKSLDANDRIVNSAKLGAAIAAQLRAEQTPARRQSWWRR
jgi:hypothetical protein